jgi:hypothetical protein
MELGFYFLFLQEQMKDIIIILDETAFNMFAIVAKVGAAEHARLFPLQVNVIKEYQLSHSGSSPFQKAPTSGWTLRLECWADNGLADRQVHGLSLGLSIVKFMARGNRMARIAGLFSILDAWELAQTLSKVSADDKEVEGEGLWSRRRTARSAPERKLARTLIRNRH